MLVDLLDSLEEDMIKWLIYEIEYAEDGCVVVSAWTKKGAARKWRQMTGTRGPVSDHPPLDISPMEAGT